MKDKNTDGIIIKVINGKEERFYTTDYVFDELRKMIKDYYGNLERNRKK